MTDEQLELFPISESAKRMLSYVTGGFYDRSYVGKWIFQVMGAEYDGARAIAEELADQFFPETATWGLKYHEIKWQLPVRENLPYEERRRLIYQKRDFRAPMTPATIETYLRNALGFDVYVCDVHDAGPYGYVPPHPNVFKVFFVGEETLDTKKAHKIIDGLKQSHTIYKINDRMEIAIDESRAEWIRLANVKNYFTIPFWDCRSFDGSWQFDGSAACDAVRRYCLVLGLKYNLGGTVGHEEIRMVSAAFQAEINTEKSIKARVHCCLGLNFGNPRRFYDRIGIKHRMEVTGKLKETVDNLTIETRTKDCWFYDGSMLFDGTKNFNSLFRKEAIE